MRKNILLIVCFVLVANVSYAGTCDAYLQNADAVSGVVPNIVEGKLKSLSIYSEGTFIAPKRSLINKARKQAELKGKRDFSGWIKEKVASGTLNEELLEQVEKTDSSGNTAGVAEEITHYSDIVGSQTESVLSGIIKLDECLDTTEKVIYVRMGWKAALSKMAGDTRATIDNEVAWGERGKISKPPTQGFGNAPALVTKEEGANAEAGVKIIKITVDGVGDTKDSALRNALRQAVAQVFGESFESKTQNIESLLAVEMSGVVNSSQAVEVTAMTEKTRSKTKGVIHSYNIASSKEVTSGVSITVNVSLAKYDKGIDAGKKSIVILRPKYTAKNKSVSINGLIDGFQDAIEAKLSASGQFNILDRESTADLEKEMRLIEEKGDIVEIARIGNMAGADLIVITNIRRYAPIVSTRQVGDKTINNKEINATVSLKLVDPATSNIVLSRNIVVNKYKIVGAAGQQSYINIITTKVVNKIKNTFGKKNVAKAHSVGSGTSVVDRSTEDVNKRFNKLKRKSNDDW